MGRWTATVAGIAVSVVAVVGIAQADEAMGKIQKVDQDMKMLVLEDGTELTVPEGTAMDQLTEGTTVKATYEEKDGKKVVTAIEVVAE
jgi:Cu/Ag efflux protein CusF